MSVHTLPTYVLEDFSCFPRDPNGRILCPIGNYTRVACFPSGCVFAADSVFDVDCVFERGSSFGSGCIFGAFCSFGEDCRFSSWTTFGKGSVFGRRCEFGPYTSFGESCDFWGQHSFEGGYKAKEGYPLMSFGGFGTVARTTYAFNTVDGIIVRCGCFLGTLDRFREKVRITRGGTPYEKAYLAIADLIELAWPQTPSKKCSVCKENIKQEDSVYSLEGFDGVCFDCTVVRSREAHENKKHLYITDTKSGEEVRFCSWCEDIFSDSEGAEDADLGFLCYGCIDAIRSRGEELHLNK